jgi:hypothetical protein
MALIAASRPAPGPLTIAFTVFSPCSVAARAAASPARCAANAVDFREPRKPIAPALLCEITLPCGSVNVISVLLNVALINALPCGTNFFSRRRVRCLGMFISLLVFLAEGRPAPQWFQIRQSARFQCSGCHSPGTVPMGRPLASDPQPFACGRVLCGRWSLSAVLERAGPADDECPEKSGYR